MSRQEKEVRLKSIVVVTNIIIFLMSFVILSIVVAKGFNKTIEKQIIFRHLVGLEINKKIEELLSIGRSEDVYLFFDKITNNRNVTYNIITSALVFELPISIAFAVPFHESRFNPTLIGNNGTSVDVGLNQLNNVANPEYTIDQLLDIKTNCRVAHGLLTKYYKQTGNNWIYSFLKYHRGNQIDELGLVYANKILTKQLEYEELFNRDFLNGDI
jgi:hypothetical protein